MWITLWGQLSAEKWRIQEIKSKLLPNKYRVNSNTKTTAENIDYCLWTHHEDIWKNDLTYDHYLKVQEQSKRYVRTSKVKGRRGCATKHKGQFLKGVYFKINVSPWFVLCIPQGGLSKDWKIQHNLNQYLFLRIT